MKKVLLVATVQTHIIEFHKPLISILHEQGAEVHIAAKDNLADKDGLTLDFVEKVFDVPFSRSPKSKDNFKALKMLKKIIAEEGYDLIQCNTPMGGIITRLAAKKARKKGTKVVYMAHGFHFCEGAPKKNWLIYYPIEKHFAKKCDLLITITDEDYKLASQKFKTKVVEIHGVGVYEDRYHYMPMEQRAAVKESLNLKPDDFVIICTGEFNKNKNQKVLISAAKVLKEKIPNLRILFAGIGALKNDIEEKAKEEGVFELINFLGYRKDLEKIVPACDLVVSCSYREGLPLNIIEAMLSHKPVVASINRGHKQLVQEGKTGYLFNPDDHEELAQKILLAYDRQDREEMGKCAYESAQPYTVTAVDKELREVYRLEEGV